MKRVRGAPLVLVLATCVLAACSLFDVSRVPVAADEPEALIFAERIQGFYGALENIPIDSLFTFKNRELRAYFVDEQAFSDYYASLAGELRDSAFANGRAERVEINEFRFPVPGEATVDLTLVGRHMRRLRFWERKLYRTDAWQQVDGVWMVNPSKL